MQKVEISADGNSYSDITPYIAKGGFKWQRNDVESSDAGRDMAGTMHRGRVTSKVKLEIKCRPMKSSEISIVLQAIYPEYVYVRYVDPQQGTTVVKQMYSSSAPATHCLIHPNGDEWWDEISFSLIEV